MMTRNVRAPAYLLAGLVALTLALGAGAPAPARGAVDLRICGKVTAYVPATALTTGLLTVDAVPLVIAAGTDVSAEVKVGANLCFALTIGTSGQITDLTVSANATTRVSICGVVRALARADADSTGSLTIGRRTLVLAVGSDLPAIVRVGADICADLTLNGFGQVKGADAQANVTSTVHVCGTVTSYARATATATGRLGIGGRSFVTAAGSELPASVAVGKDLCAALELNVIGQVQDGMVQADVRSTLEVCGEVTTAAHPTATSDGSLAMAGKRYVLRAGTDLDAAVRAGAFLKVRLSMDVFGEVANVTVLRAAASLAAACGSAAPDPSDGPGPTDGPAPSDKPSPSDDASPSGDPSPSAPADPPSGGDDEELRDEVLGESESNSEPDGAEAAAGAANDDRGGLIPDTASLGRTGSVLVFSAVPFALLLLALGVGAIQRRLREVAP